LRRDAMALHAAGTGAMVGSAGSLAFADKETRMPVQTSSPVLAEDRAEYEAEGKALKQRGIRYCLAAYADVHGVGKAKCVPIDHFSTMMRGSELFTGAALDGLGQEPSDDELSIRPDLDRIVEL